MNNKYVWLEFDTIYRMHEQQILQYGGSTGIRSYAALNAALTRPQQIYHYEPTTPLTHLAAYYALSITQAHPFLDGNKRTALTACHTFLRNHRYYLDVTYIEKYRKILAISSNNMSDQEFIEWIEHHTRLIKEHKHNENL